MLQITFLGHQGFMVETDSTRVLIDPLLGDGFGHRGLCGVLHPPRRIDIEAFPPVDAVVITHEHDDHFDVPSLACLDRAIPIHLSARSSDAAHALLRELGSGGEPLQPEAELAIGDLHFHTFVADHRDGRNGDEWDVVPFLVRDAAGHGSLLSSVDVRPSPAMLARLPRLAARAGIWAHANNVTSDAFQRATPLLPADPDADDASVQTEQDAMLGVVARRHDALERAWGTPVAGLVVGGGWSFGGERAWLDHHAFPLSCERIAADLADRCPRGRFFAPAPGQAFVMREGRLVAERPRGDFIAALPRAQWPAREFRGDHARLSDYAPACGRRTLCATALERLQHELRDLARHLHGSAVFRSLCSLPTGPVEGRLPALALSLRNGSEPVVLRYHPGGCGFVVHHAADPIEAFMSGLELWASDLLALIDGELSPSALCYVGRMRTWNHDPQRLWVSPNLLWTLAHPLRRPEAAAVLYRRLLADVPPGAPRIRARSPREGLGSSEQS
ncbi:MBL fold metallo-hydrolase [Paraliomyxa miuraensis]|uniref:MBL fold metallo-hydrolase n=1 Tax=Paraliomyxa miuraensis TaxID=376150 RepID=UPI0022582D1F|nr:MBL fold metallo-hydrolase [Paraliomyxa miuraensis]MCX4244252.1 MBL fold metallo-hydrolase [Paraliomyxa miuraensis]